MTLSARTCETCDGTYKPVAPRQVYCSSECVPCGTYAGWNLHAKRGESPCDDCRAAQSAYARRRRAANPDTYEREKIRDKARERALWKLAQKYPKPFQRLYEAELKGISW